MTAETAVSDQQSAVSRWKNLGPRTKDFLTHVIGQVRILKKAYPGIMHFMLFWGVGIQVVGTIINLLNMALFQPWVIEWPRVAWYLGYELVMDIAGVMILIGVGMAAFRRYVLKPKSLGSNWDDGFALVLLTLIVLVATPTRRHVSCLPVRNGWPGPRSGTGLPGCWERSGFHLSRLRFGMMRRSTFTRRWRWHWSHPFRSPRCGYLSTRRSTS